MWGRCEGKDGENSFGIAVRASAVVLFLLCTTNSISTILSQDLPECITQLIELNAQDGSDGGNLEEILSLYEDLLINPMRINEALLDDLEGMAVFSSFQIQSLLDYRLEYGDILSASELSLVDGFNQRMVLELLSFISFGRGEVSLSGRRRIRNDLILRSKFKASDLEKDYVGIPIYYYSKYRLRYGNKVQFGFTLENDVGEPMVPDFASAYLQFKNIRLSRRAGMELKSLVLGDFTARLGQGLSLWKSFSLSSISSPSAIHRRGGGLIPYTSSDEQNFFRGVGLTLGVMGSLSLSFLYSDNLLDARVEDGVFLSLPTGGYHNTDSYLESRKTLGESVVGGSISYRGDVFMVGFTSVSYRFDKENGRKVLDYNRYQMYDGWWGNASMDFYAVFRRIRLFGEVGVDYGASPALLAGVVYQGSSIELSMLYRYYSKSYIARHAGAYSSLSSCSNQNGILFSTKYAASRYSLEGNLDLVYYPWVRYGVKSSSIVLKSYVQYKYSFNSKHSLYLRFSSKWTDYEHEGLSKLRFNYGFKEGGGFEFSSRAEVCYSLGDMGGLLYMDFRYLFPCEKWFVNIRTTFFHVDSWDSRVYAYERDLPGSFSVPAFYGRGVAMYLVASYKLRKNINLVLKASRTRFISDKSNQTGVKIQLNLLF